jgi:ABC-type transport system involved in cytochrome bd biosynthesis fused ATPase/permease subunit
MTCLLCALALAPACGWAAPPPALAPRAPVALPPALAPAAAAAPPPAPAASARVSRSAEEDATVVDVAGVCISVGAAPARELLCDASLRLAAGGKYALLGRNGAG